MKPKTMSLVLLCMFISTAVLFASPDGEKESAMVEGKVLTDMPAGPGERSVQCGGRGGWLRWRQK